MSTEAVPSPRLVRAVEARPDDVRAGVDLDHAEPLEDRDEVAVLEEVRRAPVLRVLFVGVVVPSGPDVEE